MKKTLSILLFVSLFFTNIITCQASTKTFDRNDLENYGVNKDWKITEQNKSKVLKTPAVDAKEKIYDYADILGEEEEKELKQKIDDFITTTKMDMVIVIPTFSYYSDQENEDYAANFYDYNDFGMDFDNNSGILFLRNANPEDPYFNIYTFGSAQLYFNYDRLENTLDNIYYDISNKQYQVAFEKFIDEMTDYYKSGIPKVMKSYKVNKEGYLYKIYTIPWIPVILISLTITLIIMLILVKKNKMVLKASEAAEYINKESIKITERKDTFITSHTSSYTISSSSGGGGGFSSSGGSSGGGHSSGGGRHG